MKTSLVALAAVVTVAVAACGGSKDANKGNFKSAIQKYLDSKPGACVPLPDKDLPFKIEKSGGFFRDRIDRADALVDAGMLAKRDADVPIVPGATKTTPGFEYDLTSEGKKQLVKAAGGNIANWDGFCAGKYQVLDVMNFTDPADAFGTRISRVNYTYKVDAPAQWAKSPKVQTAFPQLAKDLKDDASDKAVLVLTNDGWMHERLFKANGG